MAVPLQVSYRDITQSDALDQLIADEAAKLERYFSGAPSTVLPTSMTRWRRSKIPPSPSAMRSRKPGVRCRIASA